MGPLQRNIIWCAQFYGEGLRHKLSREVKQQPNFDKHSTRLKKNFCSATLEVGDSRDLSDPCNCEKHCKRDARGRVRQALGWTIYTTSFTPPQKHVYLCEILTICAKKPNMPQWSQLFYELV